MCLRELGGQLQTLLLEVGEEARIVTVVTIVGNEKPDRVVRCKMLLKELDQLLPHRAPLVRARPRCCVSDAVQQSAVRVLDRDEEL